VLTKRVSFVLLCLLVLGIFIVQPVLSKPPPKINGHFTLTASGSAFKINETSIVKLASLSIIGEFEGVGKNTKTVKLNDLSGSITIDGASHDIISGKGVYNVRTGKIIITAKVDVQPGEKGHSLILYGHISSGYSELGGPVVFRKPQSKLGASYFLVLNGYLQLTVESSAA
jgi:hypothetical protein